MYTYEAIQEHIRDRTERMMREGETERMIREARRRRQRRRRRFAIEAAFGIFRARHRAA